MYVNKCYVCFWSLSILIQDHIILIIAENVINAAHERIRFNV